MPAPPDDLGLPGRGLWLQIWEAGRQWIAPSDRPAVELACRLADDLHLTREVFAASRAPQFGRLCVSFGRELAASLSRLGFDPAARSRLGVAEVKKASALDELLARRARRS